MLPRLQMPRPAPLQIPPAGLFAGGDDGCPVSPCSKVRTPVHRTLFQLCNDSGLQQQQVPQQLQPQEQERQDDATEAPPPPPAAPATSTARSCVEQWLDVMEECSRRSCSSTSSSSSICSFASLDSCSSSMLSGSTGRSSLAMPAQQQDHQMQELQDGEGLLGTCNTLTDSLPPPAFVVLGLLSAS